MNVPEMFSAALDYRVVTGLKAVIAAGGTLVLAWELLDASGRFKRLRGGLLAMLAFAAWASWWNFGHFHYPDYLQIHEHFHYYIGSKYFHEIGYTRLYDCVAVADIEDGLRRDVARRWMRNLETNVLETSERITRNPSLCTSHFSPERWASFKGDVAWFRSHRTPENWRLSQMDHGYNATPVWGVAGQLLAATGPASTTRLTLLALIDPALLLVAWGFVWWAFGWRVLCVALIWWGTNYPARYIWTGGAFLRADWLAFSIISVCLAKRGWMAASGFTLTYAALLRIFPGFIVIGLVLNAVARMWRTRSFRLQPAHYRFAAGASLALVFLLGVSAMVVGRGFSGGVEAWRGFVSNSEKHLSTPVTNNMGLKTVVAYSLDTRVATISDYYLDAPFDTWRAARRRLAAERAPIFWLLTLAFLGMLVAAVRHQEDWVALALGVTLIPITTELTCYYYSVLVLLALLYDRMPWVGVGLCALASVSCLVPAAVMFDDDVYFVLSALVVGVIVAVTLIASRRSASANGDPSGVYGITV
jgi:hypothetical protein